AVIPAESTLAISVDRTGMGELEPSLRYLVEYPYGCLEQTLSRFIPLAKVQDLATSLDSKALAGTKLDRYIKIGAAKVVRHQHSDGHYSLWPSGPTYPHLTVYATYGLWEAKRAGVAVDEQAMARGADAIRRWANDGTRKVGPDGDSATMAMAAFVLAETGKPDTGLDARLYEGRRGLPRYGQAFLLRALARAKAPAAQIRTLESELLAAASAAPHGGVMIKETAGELDWYMNSDVRSTAMVLAALLETAPGNPIVDRLAEGLRGTRSGGGTWSSTQDNLWALIALADYARRQADGQATFTVDLGGKKIEKTVHGHEVFALRQSLADVPPGKLVITSKDRVRYAVRLTAAREDKAPTPVDRGFQVTRKYLDARSGKPVTVLAAGQLVKVIVTVKTPVDRTFVAVVDHLPAGLEAVNTRLATSQQQATRGYGYYPSYRWWWGWTHQELRDDRVLAFADRMQAGDLQLEYLARASLPGTYRTLPATAEAMYQPEINGRTAGETVTVK
ncbi:MAG TPA: hypothetical protein VL172_13785, partial [Kofleriaceae bacterium]|nr:hypothetical protein [Kofleriaceae bacterium]